MTAAARHITPITDTVRHADGTVHRPGTLHRDAGPACGAEDLGPVAEGTVGTCSCGMLTVELNDAGADARQRNRGTGQEGPG